VLSTPFRPNRTDKMSQRRDIDLWRVRVNRDVRITFRIEDGYPVILHVGRHECSDAFVARYREADEPSQPLEEVELMKTASKITRVSIDGSAALAMAVPSPGDELVRLLTALMSQVVRQDQQAGKELVLDEVARLTGLVKELEDQVAQMLLDREDDDETGKVQALLDEAHAELARARGAPSGDAARLSDEQHELRQSLVGCQGRLDEQGRRLGHARSDLQAQLNALMERVEALAEDVAWLKEKEVERQKGWLRRLFRGWWR
jgi:hypothetical protein